MARFDPVITITCDKNGCFEDLQIQITDIAHAEDEVRAYMDAHEWREQIDGFFCAKHCWRQSAA